VAFFGRKVKKDRGSGAEKKWGGRVATGGEVAILPIRDPCTKREMRGGFEEKTGRSERTLSTTVQKKEKFTIRKRARKKVQRKSGLWGSGEKGPSGVLDRGEYRGKWRKKREPKILHTVMGPGNWRKEGRRGDGLITKTIPGKKDQDRKTTLLGIERRFS